MQKGRGKKNKRTKEGVVFVCVCEREGVFVCVCEREGGVCVRV